VDSSPAVANGVVYVSSDDGRVYALDAATGEQMWNYTIGGTPYWDSFASSSPAIANGVVYVGSYDGKVYAFGSSPGTPEFTSYLILPGFMVATLVAALILKKKRNGKGMISG
jgi:outer membrane protein assembly factor BamB